MDRSPPAHLRHAGSARVAPKTVLLLADDQLLLQDLSDTLAPFSQTLRLVRAADEPSARRVLDDHQVALLVVDLAASLMDGFAVACHVLKTLPAVPIVALTRDFAPVAPADRHPGFWMMPKPIDLNRFRERVLTLLDRSPQGHLTDFSLVGLLQLLSFEQRSAVLVVEAPEGKGTLVISHGELVDAEADGLLGEEAAHHILKALARSTNCSIVLERVDDPVQRRIQTSLTSLLLEAAKRQDDLDREGEWATGV